MFRVVLKSLAKNNRLLKRESRATYIRGFWPEPITQQTLDKFLEDINYFEEPKKFTNIGIESAKLEEKRQDTQSRRVFETTNEVKVKAEPSKVDEILDLLGHDAKTPPLNLDDCRLQGIQLVNLAVNHGIFRDLFGEYHPSREYINFTPEQAERLSKLVPHYWITDQPFARAARGQKEPEPMKIFDPVIGISARFVHEHPKTSHDQQTDELFAHTSYYGNIIPASEALIKPSITLDGHLLSPKGKSGDFISESAFNNWTPGQVTAVNFSDKHVNKFYSIALVNLDHLHENAANLHWMLTNIKPTSSDDALKYEEVCDYLPVHGINGYGYSRYVFIVFQHDSQVKTEDMKIQDFSLESRRFDANLFLEKHQEINMKPTGLSWFQTTWDQSSNSIFHDYLKLKAPVYEHVQPKTEKIAPSAYPRRVPFNIYLDHYREKKDINEQVLLERLSSVDPFDYKDQYVKPKVPPTIHEVAYKPSWMRTVMFKKNNKLGYWRGLRPASMTLPLDNNVDLDYPIRPIASSKKSPPEFPNQYPAKIKYKRHKDMPTSKPVNEHQNVFIQEDHEIHLDSVMKVMKEFEKEKS